MENRLYFINTLTNSFIPSILPETVELISNSDKDKLIRFEGNEDLLNKRLYVHNNFKYKLSSKLDGFPKKWKTNMSSVANDKNDYEFAEGMFIKEDYDGIRKLIGSNGFARYKVNDDTINKIKKLYGLDCDGYVYYPESKNYPLCGLLKHLGEPFDYSVDHDKDCFIVTKNKSIKLDVVDFLYREQTPEVNPIISTVSDGIDFASGLDSENTMNVDILKQIDVRAHIKELLPVLVKYNQHMSSENEDRIAGLISVLDKESGNDIYSKFLTSSCYPRHKKGDFMYNAFKKSKFNYTNEELKQIKEFIDETYRKRFTY